MGFMNVICNLRKRALTDFDTSTVSLKVKYFTSAKSITNNFLAWFAYSARRLKYTAKSKSMSTTLDYTQIKVYQQGSSEYRRSVGYVMRNDGAEK